MHSLLEWRKEFPIVEKTTYLISHSLGAMPRRTADALQEFAAIWASRGIRAWEEGWWEMPVTIGNLIGSIIGAGRNCDASERFDLSVTGYFLF
jgi:kynureninase